MNPSNFRLTLFGIALLLLGGSIGYRMGQANGAGVRPTFIPTGTTQAQTKQVDMSLFWLVWDRVGQKFFEKKAIDPTTMMYGAISGMVASLDDPYTMFLPPKENKDVKDDLGGLFEGIGAQLGMKDKRIIVIAPLSKTPAEKAGIKPGDWILKVDGKDTSAWTLPQAVSAIRGPKGTKVALTILHDKDNKPIDLSIARDTIHVASVEWEKSSVECTGENCKLVEKGKSCTTSPCETAAWLKLTRFGDQTQSEWDKAVGEIAGLNCGKNNPNCRGIVFDLRNNPGGYLTGAVYIGSEFLPDGIVVKQKSYDGKVQTYTIDHQGRLLTVPVVVLVNKGSASASEIVSGALKARGRAKLVGETTFGKGSVQDTEDFGDGAGLHVTIAQWLLPDDSLIHGKGITPDVVIEASDSGTLDVQLQKAIEVVSE